MCDFTLPPALPAALRPRVARLVAANLERLDGLGNELLDGRLSFDRWPFRMPGEAVDPTPRLLTSKATRCGRSAGSAPSG
jgi:hypothetical protein